MMLFHRRERFLSLQVLILLWPIGKNEVTAFLVRPDVAKTPSSSSHLWMGLYDKPLPPQPPPLNDDDDNDDEDDEVMEVSSQLFQLQGNGREVNDLLPPLGRRLDQGIGCYFEPNDKLVQNLVDKTSCSVEDACWALEACKGDWTEAWTRISVARRNQLERSGPDSDVSDSVEKEYNQKRQARLEKEQTRERLERMKRTKPDTEWSPIQNPKPIDDEPWFTV